MKIEIVFTEQPVAEPPCEFGDGIGAVAEFRGIVRGREDGAAIHGLVYEIYEPMAKRVIEGILAELAGQHPCVSALVVHRWGRIPVGETAIFLRVASAHRSEAFRVQEGFMHRLKQEVPIWKVGTW